MIRFYINFLVIFFILFSFSYSNEIINSDKISKDKIQALYYYQKSADYINHGQSRLAVENLELSIKFDPSYAISYLILGDIYAEDPILLDYNKAIKFYNKFLENKDEDSSIYVSDVYKKIADVYLEMASVGNLDDKNKLDILKKSSDAYEKSLELSFSEENSRNKSLVFVSLAYINAILGKYSKALSYIDKVDPEISKYLPEYNFCCGLINMKMGKDDLAIKYFERIEKNQLPYFNRAKICLDKIIVKKSSENVIFIILLIVLFILLFVLSFVIYKYVYKNKINKFSISDLKEMGNASWKYRDNFMNTLEELSHFTAKTFMNMVGANGAYFFFVNADRTKLNILEGVNAGEFDFSVVELNHSEDNSKLWFDRRGAIPFTTKAELNESSYLNAFPKISDFIKKCNISVGIPIYYVNWFIGIVYLSNVKNLKKYEKNINEIKMFSSRMSHIIADKIRTDSVYIDHQTGLYNALYYDKKIAELAEVSKNSNIEFSVLRILIDRYQNLEDIFGENYILTMRNMAIDLISEIISSNQFICLISKCEFSIIIENLPFDEAYSKATLINKRISDIHLTYQSDYLSTSIAVGTFSSSAFDIETFKASLESAFIFAINNGGNRVISIEEAQKYDTEDRLKKSSIDIDIGNSLDNIDVDIDAVESKSELNSKMDSNIETNDKNISELRKIVHEDHLKKHRKNKIHKSKKMSK